MTPGLPHLLLTPGEPAGIGPELVLRLACQPWQAAITAVADRGWLEQLAADLRIPVNIIEAQSDVSAAHQPGVLPVQHVPAAQRPVPGKLDTANARYVLSCLDVAVDHCASHAGTALVTAPVHKGIINDAGIAFTGHTEYLAHRLGCEDVVMMLADHDLRVALVTTHLPLKDVAAAVTRQRLARCIQIVHADLQRRFGLPQPRILVLGLNPHAGEQGHLGHEEQAIIEPLLDELRGEGIQLQGPLPADTAFTPANLSGCDVVLAMYHDQGLTPLKARSFGQIANITLGLPIVRTSVDHGTALDLAGLPADTPETQRARIDSLVFACEQAINMCHAVPAGPDDE